MISGGYKPNFDAEYWKDHFDKMRVEMRERREADEKEIRENKKNFFAKHRAHIKYLQQRGEKE